MRGGIKRSRGGCLRCKEKKLKCDETKPWCIRCGKRNVICPGYRKDSGSLDLAPLSDTEHSERRDSIGVETTLSEPASDNDHAEFGQTSPLFTDIDFDVSWNSIEGLEIPGSISTSYSNTIVSLQPSFPTTTAVSSEPLLGGHNSIWSPPTVGTLSKTSGRSGHGESWKSEPQSLTRPAGRILNDYSSMLVEYYFKEVAGLFSCYDSQLNPFRTTVSKLWQSSNPVFYVVQSMAAACLTDVVPNLHFIGSKMRNMALACVEADIRNSTVDTGSLLTLIMLGLSASWHEANDLGRKEFEHARTIMRLLQKGRLPAILENNNRRNLQFFQEAMIYWEMLLSYVSDVSGPLELPEGREPPSPAHANDLPEPSFPHPWTGVGREAQVIVFEVGRLVRRERHRIKNRPSFTSLADIDTGRKALDTAHTLASRLRNLILPTEEAVVSPGDAQTPVRHLLAIAEAYRLTGLLQLYRVFPDLLTSHDRDERQVGLPAEWHADSGIIDKRLTALALEIVNLLEKIPIESRTRCVQPFLLVTVASELRTTTLTDSSEGLGDQDRDFSGAANAEAAIAVLEARKFVICRLSTFEHVLPAKPIRQMCQIVKHTWERIDKGLANVYWMDVMTEQGLETTMG